MTVSQEIRGKLEPAILSAPAFRSNLEKKYFEPMAKTIQVGFTECDDTEKKALIPKESVDAKR